MDSGVPTDLRMTEGAGIVQRDQTAVVSSVHVRARLKQVVHHVSPTKAWNKSSQKIL